MICDTCYGDTAKCKGGGNLGCARRNPRPSHCAGIIDTYGSVRFIVAHQKDFKHHARHDELLIVVPDLLVHEPIAWGDIPGCIRRIERAIEEWIARGIPNEPIAKEAVTMYRLRCQELNQRSLDFSRIVET